MCGFALYYLGPGVFCVGIDNAGIPVLLLGAGRILVGRRIRLPAAFLAKERENPHVFSWGLIAVQLLFKFAALLCFERQRCSWTCQQAWNADRLASLFAPAIIAAI